MRGPRSIGVAVIAAVAVSAAVAGVVAVVGEGGSRLGTRSPDGLPKTVALPAEPASALEALERRLDGVPGSRRHVGEFDLGGGRTLRLHAIATVRGATCLIDDEDGVALGSVCLDRGFERRRVAFSINSSGGPGRSGELYLAGLAAPEVGAIVLARTDGSSVRLAVGRSNAFLYEASAADLARDVLPSRIDVYARGGRLLERVDIPVAG